MTRCGDSDRWTSGLRCLLSEPSMVESLPPPSHRRGSEAIDEAEGLGGRWALEGAKRGMYDGRLVGDDGRRRAAKRRCDERWSWSCRGRLRVSGVRVRTRAELRRQRRGCPSRCWDHLVAALWPLLHMCDAVADR